MQHSAKFLDIVNDAKTRIREVTVEEVKSDREGGVEHVLVDTREDAEWNRRACGRCNPPRQGGLSSATSRERSLITDTKIVLYCGGGYRSALGG